jgi:hypothetical protein
MMGFKRQQDRWATGFSQCFLKVQAKWAFKLCFGRRRGSHTSWAIAHPLMVLILLILPLMIRTPCAFGRTQYWDAWHADANLISQSAYSDWPRRFLLLPLLIALGIGTSLSNTFAVFRAFSRHTQVFERTPKFNGHGDSAGIGWGRSYMLSVDFITWLELLLAVYAICMMFLSIQYAPELTPFTILYVIGYGYVSGMSLYQSILAQQHRAERQRAWMGLSGSSGR